MADFSNNPQGDLAEKTKKKTKKPDMYRVLLHNDDYTTMEFVVEVLMAVFRKDAKEATRIMLDVHQKGRGTVGVYTHDVASTRLQKVHQMARDRQFPLKCTMEPA